MKNLRKLSIFSFITLMAFIMSGCGDTNSDSTTKTETKNLKNYNITLSGENEVPAITTASTSSGTLTLNTDDNTLSGSFTFSGFTPTAAHIHKGFAGTNGAVVFPLELSADSKSFAVPSATVLDSTELASLKNGELYVNIHSETFPSGELRGQVLPSDVTLYKVALGGANEVPAITTSATGTAYLTVNKTSGNLGGTVKTTGMTPTAAHIHTGASGANGPVLIGLEVESTDTNNFNVPTGTMLDTTGLASLNTQELYVNVHSALFPSGELRGQIGSSTTTVDNTAKIAAGKTKYEASCVACHSSDGSGGIGPDLRSLPEAIIKSKLTAFKASGTGTMGNIASNLSDEEIENLSLYIETL